MPCVLKLFIILTVLFTERKKEKLFLGDHLDYPPSPLTDHMILEQILIKDLVYTFSFCTYNYVFIF